MEYLIGSLVTVFVGTWVFYFYKNFIIKNNPIKKVKKTQSYVHRMYSPVLLDLPDRRPKKRQSYDYASKHILRVAFTDEGAFWIKDNQVYRAEVNHLGFIEESTAKVVDMMGMDKVQLDKMMDIVEELTKDKNDNWSAGD